MSLEQYCRDTVSSFWNTPDWHAYEKASGAEPGARARLLREASFMTRVIDLKVSSEQLWEGVRRSYHAPINRLLKDRRFNVKVTTKIDEAHALHAAQAGRETRPQGTWDIQHGWLLQGRAFLFGGYRDGVMVGFAYIVNDDTDWHYYFSAASSEPNVQHAIQWTALRWLHRRSRSRYYEMGWQGEATDVKGKNIEFFRRGFGGEDKPAAWRETA